MGHLVTLEEIEMTIQCPHNSPLLTPSVFKHAKLSPTITSRVDANYSSRVISEQIMNHPINAPVALQLVSNDYLALSRHPDVIEAMIRSLSGGGNGTPMSGVFIHGTCAQTALQQRLARLMQAQSGLLCQSGYAANVGLLQSIANSETIVHIDMLAHISLWEGIRSAGAIPVAFIHNSYESLEKNILRHGPGVVVIDSIYSTTGAIAPIREVVEVCERHECVLIVDESNSLGTHGPMGAGLVAEMGLSHRVQFRTASLAKAFSGRAGFVACSKQFSEYLRFESLPAIFSSPLLPHDIAGLNATLTVVQNECWRRELLRNNAKIVREELTAMGYNLNDSQSQIISLESGPEECTLLLHKTLIAKGIMGAPFIAPATPKNRSLIRFSLHAALNSDEIEKIISICKAIRHEVGMYEWPSTKRLVRTKKQPIIASTH
jgi:CAI-1 autoinducer synthase